MDLFNHMSFLAALMESKAGMRQGIVADKVAHLAFDEATERYCHWRK
jgi:hypothetical protein